jgi:hypothetical protein
MTASENVTIPTEIEIIIPTADEKPAFERLPWKVLDADAFEASQAHIGANFGRAPMAMAILASRSKVLGHSLSETEYRELVQKDEIPEEHQMCSWPGCNHKVSPFRTALVLNGEIAKNRDGVTVWRGNFLVLKLAEGGLQVRGFCGDHLAKARQSAEDAVGERLHPMPFAEATARRQGIIDSFRRRQEAQETFEASLAGRSTALRGRFGSAPRNNVGNIGRRR